MSLKVLEALIAKRYPSPEWALFFEVQQEGFDGGRRSVRRADAVALGIWPSRGCAIIGFELKIDRRDWLRELKDPAKAEIVAKQCDRWFVVSIPGVVKLEEVPETWGLLESTETGKQLTVRRPAPEFTDRDKRVMSRSFAAAMLRRVTETTTPNAAVSQLVEERVKAGIESSTSGREIKALEARIVAYEQALADFEVASGLRINSYYGSKTLGESVRQWQEAQRSLSAIKQFSASLRVANERIESLLATWPTTGGETK